MTTCQPLHEGRNCAFMTPNGYQVEVIRHDAVGMDLNTSVLTRLDEQFDKPLVVAVFEEDLPLVVRTIDDMQRGTSWGVA